MFEGVSNPVVYGLGVVLFGGWILLVWVIRMLFIGKIRTEREVFPIIEENAALRETNKELAQQNNMMMTETVPVMNNLMTALRARVEGSDPP